MALIGQQLARKAAEAQAYAAKKHAEECLQYYEATTASPIRQVAKVRGTWLPIVPGKTRIPRVGQ